MPRQIDKSGNILFFEENGIFLKLKSDPDKKKKIFHIQGRTVIKYVNHNHLMKRTKVGPMVGFNYDAIKWLKDKKVKYIHLASYNGRLLGKVGLHDLLEEKEFLHFKKEGFERQIFYPMEKVK